MGKMALNVAPRLTLPVRMILLLIAAAVAGLVSQFTAGSSRRLSTDILKPVVKPVLAEARPSAPPAAAAPIPAPTPAPIQTPTQTQAQPKAQPKSATPPAPAPAPSLPQREISGAEAQEAQRKGWPFLDARRSREYQDGHIPGALTIPVWEANHEERLIRFDATGYALDAPVVVYCGGGDCRDSHLLAEKLMALGYRHILIYKDGYIDWLSRGLPVRKGEQP